PIEVHGQIFHDLTVDDLLNYELVDKTAHEAIKSFYRNVLQVEHVLSPYFGTEDAKRFRVLQYATGLLISGSTALSFFTRQTFEGSDLDLYIDFALTLHLAYFLFSCSYRYKPYRNEFKHQPDRIEDAVEEMHLRVRSHQFTTIDGEGIYNWGGVGDVFNFFKVDQKIQIIACATPPLMVILRFHSTVVMNVIGYSHAISLYPQATFRDKITLTTRGREGDPYEKYEKRGW
ncbi:hypothetical protein L218DRAFT_882521, partial [Marasmius fiardii PR-910]